MLTDVNAPKVYPCATCSKPATIVCWGEDLCVVCHGTWWADPQFDAGSIEAAVGIDSRACPKPGDSELYCAEATKRTRAWAAAQRAKARAA
jgi:hypothetical protein